VATHWFDAEGNVGNQHLGGNFAVFEYMYRDAGNWKTHGAMLLIGDTEGVREPLRKLFEWGDLFVAEQVGIPSLCDEHFAACGEGPSDLDHAYHEFVDLRPATDEEVARLLVAGTLDGLVERMQAVAGCWDVTLSPNCCV
jgi:hypothetical protein